MTDLPAVISSSAASVGLLLTAWQIFETRKQDQHNRRIALEGVSVSWQILEAPDRPRGEGDAQWLYRFTIQNPGHLPVDEVAAVIRLGQTVRRIRTSGRLGDPTTTLTLRTPVLPAGGSQDWKRRLILPLDAGAPLNDASAALTFRDVEMHTRTTTWPRRTTTSPG